MAKKTPQDELLNTLYHLNNARKALLRSDWTNPRDVTLRGLDKTYTSVQGLLRAERMKGEPHV